MPLLILQCAIFDKALAIRILHQDDAIERCNFKFIASNDYVIMSSSMPALNDEGLYIQGEDDSEDGKVAHWIFEDNFQRDLCLNAIQVAVGELNQHYKATGKPTPPLAAPVSAITIMG